MIVTAGDDMVITLRSVPNVPILQSGGESRFRVISHRYQVIFGSK